MTMKKGEIVRMTTTPEHAFGTLGCIPRIPPNCSLEFDIELISYEIPKVKECYCARTNLVRKIN
jgi:hypothetical protein